MKKEGISSPHLFLVFWKAWQAVSRVDQASIADLGIGCFSDFVVLEALLHKGSLSISTLGNKANLTSGSITTAIQRLKRKGWIAREADPQDARSTLIQLTSQGQAVITQAFQKHSQQLDRIFTPLSTDERHALMQLLKIVGRNAESLRH